MKKKFLNAYILTVMLLTDFVMFADPGDDDDDGGLEGDDADPVPINGKLIWLAVVGILFAIYTYRSYNKKKEA